MDNTNRDLSIPFKIMIALIMAFVYAALNILLADFSLVEVPYVSIRPQLILPLLSGYLLGPFYGFTVGFLGNAMSDMVTGYGIEFLLNRSVANGLYGLIMGFFPKNEDKIRTNRSFTIFFLYILLVNIVPAAYALLTRVVEPGVDALQKFVGLGLPIVVSNTLVCTLLFPIVLMFLKKIELNFEIKITLLVYYFSLISVMAVFAATIGILYSMNLLNTDNQTFALIIYDLSIIPLVAINLIGFGISNAISQKLLNPLLIMTEDIKQMDGKSWDKKLDIHTGDELEFLATAFNEMIDKINDTMRKLWDNVAEKERLAAEKERTSTELNIAQQIQTAMLPDPFPTFPDRTEFSISGRMTPAKEIGGDFYDFFLMDDDKLVFIIADVSGKGVPAALFMMSSKEHIIDQVLTGLDVDEIFTRANHHLYKNTAEGVFLTTFLGILNLKTGILSFVNAGHNPPLLRRRNEKFEPLAMDSGFVMSILPDVHYKRQTLKLNPGDTLFLYTDGVTEAVDKNGAFFQEYRLKKALNGLPHYDDHSSEYILHQIRDFLSDFTQDAEQHDDITMLCLKFRHPMVCQN